MIWILRKLINNAQKHSSGLIKLKHFNVRFSGGTGTSYFVFSVVYTTHLCLCSETVYVSLQITYLCMKVFVLGLSIAVVRIVIRRVCCCPRVCGYSCKKGFDFG